jgi:hypothetical protein
MKPAGRARGRNDISAGVTVRLQSGQRHRLSRGQLLAGCVLTGFRLREPFVQKGGPRLFSDDAIYGQVLILL